MGSTVNIGTPSDNTVSSSILQNGSVITAKLATDAVTNAKLADQAVTLDKLPHGTSSNDGKFLRANHGADPTFEVVNTDLVADTSPQLGGDLATNSNDIVFADADKAIFGAGTDLQIFSDGSTCFLKADDLRIRSAGNENYQTFAANGTVKLFYDNSVKFETYANGCTVTGNLNAGNVDLADNAKARFGGSNDLQIYHDGSHSYIKDDGTGNLRVQTNNLRIENAAGTENQAIFNENGAVELYFDNAKKAETFNSGFKVAGGGELYIDGNAASGHCQIIMTRSDRTWGVSNETNFRIYAEGGNSSNPFSGSLLLEIDGNGHITAGSNNAQDLGTSSKRWRNIYTNDLNLSNEGSSNDVDGTWGNWTIQEGESDLFLKNNRSGKKYKFNLTEVS